MRAHFTLIFPAPGDARLMLREVQEVAASCRPFDVALTQAEVVPDTVAGGHGVFLLPSNGHAEIAALHHRLHRGSMSGARRKDLEFVPHVTVGHHASAEQCRRLARELAPRLPLAGHVAELTLLEIEGSVVWPETVTLGPRP